MMKLSRPTVALTLMFATVSIASDPRNLHDWMHYSMFLRIGELEPERIRELLNPDPEVLERIRDRYLSPELRTEPAGLYLLAKCIDITRFNSDYKSFYDYVCGEGAWSDFAAFSSVAADRYGLLALTKKADVERTYELIRRMRGFWRGERENSVSVPDTIFKNLDSVQSFLRAGGVRHAA